MIGNDIIDLNLARKQSNWERKGFLEKQFTLQEQEEICSAKNSFLKVWLFWSMKEAAYKCYTQKVEKRFFAPQNFECTLSFEGKGSVVFGDEIYYTKMYFDKDYIHTMAENVLELNNDKTTVYSAICSPKTIDQSLKKKLQNETGITFEAIEKRKTTVGAPLFYHQKKLLTKSCSISHHGKYGGFAFTLKNE